MSVEERALGAEGSDAAVSGVESFGPQRFSNRELSRLDFGARLLDLAEDGSLALLERVKFIAIFAEMLDEFFQVRVTGLEDQVAAGLGELRSLTVRAQLDRCSRQAGPASSSVRPRS